MATIFRPATLIRFDDLFDGRLEKRGIHEHIRAPVVTAEGGSDPWGPRRCLFDGENYLWVYASPRGFVERIARHNENYCETILLAIAEEFDTEIFKIADPVN